MRLRWPPESLRDAEEPTTCSGSKTREVLYILPDGSLNVRSCSCNFQDFEKCDRVMATRLRWPPESVHDAEEPTTCSSSNQGAEHCHERESTDPAQWSQKPVSSINSVWDRGGSKKASGPHDEKPPWPLEPCKGTPPSSASMCLYICYICYVDTYK
jgi:hypothetical protein